MAAATAPPAPLPTPSLRYSVVKLAVSPSCPFTIKISSADGSERLITLPEPSSGHSEPKQDDDRSTTVTFTIGSTCCFTLKSDLADGNTHSVGCIGGCKCFTSNSYTPSTPKVDASSVPPPCSSADHPTAIVSTNKSDLKMVSKVPPQFLGSIHGGTFGGGFLGAYPSHPIPPPHFGSSTSTGHSLPFGGGVFPDQGSFGIASPLLPFPPQSSPFADGFLPHPPPPGFLPSPPSFGSSHSTHAIQLVEKQEVDRLRGTIDSLQAKVEDMFRLIQEMTAEKKQKQASE